MEAPLSRRTNSRDEKGSPGYQSTDFYPIGYGRSSKPSNILITIEDPSVLISFVEHQSTMPMPQKTDPGDLHPRITDFGAADILPSGVISISPSQADAFRSPEVITGYG
ncbi:hypothetical protein VTO42DRAFT_3051 [Malbranchea cinnamomea]